MIHARFEDIVVYSGKDALAASDLIASNLRESDRWEIEASGISDPGLFFHHVFQLPEAEVYVALSYSGWEILPLAIFGVVPTKEGGAAPWMVGTPYLMDRTIAMLKMSRWCTAVWRQRYGPLMNMVWSRAGASIEWLRVVGFEVSEVPMKVVTGETFYEFVME